MYAHVYTDVYTGSVKVVVVKGHVYMYMCVFSSFFLLCSGALCTWLFMYTKSVCLPREGRKCLLYCMSLEVGDSRVYLTSLCLQKLEDVLTRGISAIQ